ncbi:hypothetical protein THAOC_14525 [Thalassiosira oceanica]|uniref:Alpha/beta hydrolase fold-3 domain-containing protein n=1 Tax=Thalassiosira oceanica TaxID=159749 RepID=K0SUQ0_THAOC|nr:hypothetical protein THAOC_14525 [Thalassiosira oceanica]|eukprot:EJK64711.1 hypothetical protein THAOC_14525 [Thalassiosira oceanica]
MSNFVEPKDAASGTPIDGFAYWVPQVRPKLEPLISGANPNFSINSPEKRSRIHNFLSKPGPTWPGVDATKLQVEGIGTLYSSPNKSGEGRSPAGTTSGVLWIHGGRIMGCSNGEQEAVACSRFVIELGIPVLSLEHTRVFPAALDDAVNAYRWFVRRLESEGTAGQSAKIAVAGESGGAGIAAELDQRLLDEKRKVGTTDILSTPACQLLIYPMLDDRTCVNGKMKRRRSTGSGATEAIDFVRVVDLFWSGSRAGRQIAS